jgi:hypothetical protein
MTKQELLNMALEVVGQSRHKLVDYDYARISEFSFSGCKKECFEIFGCVCCGL